MADSIKILAQLAPSATTLSTLYTVPAATQTSVSSIFACNSAATSTTIRISAAYTGATDEIKQYLYYDLTIPANDTFIATAGITLGTTDVIRVMSASGAVSFSLFGIEVT